MRYAEIVIGPPGSGKSTYVISKKTTLCHRSPFALNLDPGNHKDTDFDYSICSISSSREYQQKYGVGPNMSTKAILEEFCSNFEEFFRENIEETDYYLLFDFPGQIEFFICSDALNSILKHLGNNGYSVVLVNLVDLVFFTNAHALLFSYLVSTLCLGLLESAQINVISKCDNWKRLELKHPLRDIAELQNMDEIEGNRLHREMIEFIRGQGLLLYEILDYGNTSSVMNLQIAIDKASGLFFEDDYFAKENIVMVSREDVFSEYDI